MTIDRRRFVQTLGGAAALAVPACVPPSGRPPSSS